eukprot:SAG11_NODE_19763_length_459_cov_0.980556_1_plen_50_part_10
MGVTVHIIDLACAEELVTKVLCSRKASQSERGWLTRRVWVIVSFRGFIQH